MSKHTPMPTDLKIREVHYQGTPRFEILTQFSTREQAEQVVKAVDVHEELLAVAKRVRMQYRAFVLETNQSDDAFHSRTLADFDRAIAKAGGRTDD